MKYIYVLRNNEFSDSEDLGAFTREKDVIHFLKDLEIKFTKPVIEKYPELHLQPHKDECDGTTFFNLRTEDNKGGFPKYPNGEEWYYDKVPLNNPNKTLKNVHDNLQ